MSSFARRALNARMTGYDVDREIYRVEGIMCRAMEQAKSSAQFTTFLTVNELYDLREGPWSDVVTHMWVDQDNVTVRFFPRSSADVLIHKMLKCGYEFYKMLASKTGRRVKFSRDHIDNMIKVKTDEVECATDLTEKIDAYLVMAFYAADSAARDDIDEQSFDDMRVLVMRSLHKIGSMGTDPAPLIDIIHAANMSKFGEGGYLDDGEWMMPPNLIPPDDKIREEIKRQTEAKH